MAEPVKEPVLYKENSGYLRNILSKPIVALGLITTALLGRKYNSRLDLATSVFEK